MRRPARLARDPARHSHRSAKPGWKDDTRPRRAGMRRLSRPRWNIPYRGWIAAPRRRSRYRGRSAHLAMAAHPASTVSSPSLAASTAAARPAGPRADDGQVTQVSSHPGRKADLHAFLAMAPGRFGNPAARRCRPGIRGTRPSCSRAHGAPRPRRRAGSCKVTCQQQRSGDVGPRGCRCRLTVHREVHARAAPGSSGSEQACSALDLTLPAPRPLGAACRLILSQSTRARAAFWSGAVDHAPSRLRDPARSWCWSAPSHILKPAELGFPVAGCSPGTSAPSPGLVPPAPDTGKWSHPLPFPSG